MLIESTHDAQPRTECRVYERTLCDLPARCQPASVAESHEMRWAASIGNISQGGLLITLERRFEKGTALALELPGDLDHDSTIVFVKVVHLHRSDLGWALGCKFISPLSEEELQRLLTSTHHILSPDKDSCLDDEPADVL